ncbi:conjugal transfer protein TraD [Klebsiella pasteurii]|uniref:Conjugal transfer protein TraD n=1 Tax=Escherichia coli TaxID=562 RepID=A0A8H9SLJ9_ECOLX|nr:MULTISPECIES: conjugal transfer protein TraD [Enterobacteriaceae]EFF1410505.1 conjugal transfer protein TraD [Escherichia coli]EFK6264238.1 conjugal transfer protein TraD [Escherichia coli]EFL9707364.1 conjugal transfer protein TraD [Escherichia coli]EGG1130415.1 conjugal transfer protein TraD [Escherichia coli]EGI4552737.1 conjugal transfer protein TraD [Escherichia coli]
MDTKDENKKLKIKKSLQQQIASAQLRLNRLQHKSKQEAKQIETRQKIILGAEVAKAVDSNVFDVDKELVLGFLLHIRDLNDEEVIKYRKKGRAFLLEMKGRQI